MNFVPSWPAILAATFGVAVLLFPSLTLHLLLWSFAAIGLITVLGILWLLG